MERKYPAKTFWRFVVINFVLHFFYLFVPGIILSVVGIWVKACLWIGLVILGLDLILSIIEQLGIRKAAISHSENQDFNELMDALYGSGGGSEAFGKLMEEKMKASYTIGSKEEKSDMSKNKPD